MTADTDTAAQAQVGRYTLLEQTARGGMAEVWRARENGGAHDGRIVCIKRLDPLLRKDVDFIEMFRDEASLVLDFDHPNVVHMFELIDGPVTSTLDWSMPARLGTHDELAMVLEYVDGPSLARVQSALGRIGIDEVLQIGIQLAHGLHHAHTRTRYGEPLAIVHRDVSPQNVLLSTTGPLNARIKLVDFGIAKATQRLTHTRTGTLKGKCSYMAPEQVRGERIDHRADQFATGIVLWELLTGRRLFSGRNEVLILEQVARSDAVPPSVVRPEVPKHVDKVILRALGWHPRERYPDMAAFALALQSSLDAIVGEDVPVARREVGVTIDLSPLVERTERLAKPSAATGGAQRTRVMQKADATAEGDDLGVADTVIRDIERSINASGAFFARMFADDDDAAPGLSPPLLPDHTGQFLVMRRPKVRAVAILAFVVVVAGLFGALAYYFTIVKNPLVAAQKSRPPIVVTENPESAAMEARLLAVPGHPCRTELLEDLLDYRALSAEGKTRLAESVAVCERDAVSAAQIKARAKLDAPAWPKKKPRTTAVVAVRVAELIRRGTEAIAIGAYERAEALLAEALVLDETRVDLHAKLALCFRGLGDPARAALHYRLYFHAFPDDTERERAVLYLKRYRQRVDLVLSATPDAVERQVRVHRLLHEAERAPKPLLPLLEAQTLAPTSVPVLLRLGDAYLAAKKPADAKRVWQQALKLKPTRELKAKLARL